MIFIFNQKVVKIICGIGLIGSLAFLGADVNLPNPAYAKTEQGNSIAKSYGESVADPIQETIENQYPYKAEGYDDLVSWLKDVKNKIQELQGKIEESRGLNYLYDEDVAALSNIETQLSNTYSIVALGEYENIINNIFDNNAIREAEAAEKKKVLEQQQKQESYSVPSNSGALTPSKGVTWFNGRKETYYNLDMSGVIANAKNMGIQGDYWVRGDGVKMYGDYVIVAAQMDKGTIIETSLGTGIVLDYCPAGTIDIATTWR